MKRDDLPLNEVIQYALFNNQGEFDGERYMPGLEGEMELEHMHRYLAVRSICHNMVVLDIASGEGYGSALLAQTAKHVVGVEIDSATVSLANSHYAKENLEYIEGDVHNIPLPDNHVDMVVSFETLEHISGHDDFMVEIKRVLKEDGLLIMSTPDKLVYAEVSGGIDNPFHVSELMLSEFETLVRKHFCNVRMYGQRVVLASGLFSIDEENCSMSRYYRHLDNDNEILSTERPQKPIYLISVASEQDILGLPEGLFEGKLWINPLSSLIGGIKERDDELRQRDDELRQIKSNIIIKIVSKLIKKFSTIYR